MIENEIIKEKLEKRMHGIFKIFVMIYAIANSLFISPIIVRLVMGDVLSTVLDTTTKAMLREAYNSWFSYFLAYIMTFMFVIHVAAFGLLFAGNIIDLRKKRNLRYLFSAMIMGIALILNVIIVILMAIVFIHTVL